jgi:hypothetical protein
MEVTGKKLWLCWLTLTKLFSTWPAVWSLYMEGLLLLSVQVIRCGRDGTLRWTLVTKFLETILVWLDYWDPCYSGRGRTYWRSGTDVIRQSYWSPTRVIQTPLQLWNKQNNELSSSTNKLWGLCHFDLTTKVIDLLLFSMLAGSKYF